MARPKKEAEVEEKVEETSTPTTSAQEDVKEESVEEKKEVAKPVKEEPFEPVLLKEKGPFRLFQTGAKGKGSYKIVNQMNQLIEEGEDVEKGEAVFVGHTRRLA